MTDEETDRLVSEMEALPDYRGWAYSYEYPGYFCYSHDDLPYSVFFTPDWEGEESMPIEVQDIDGAVHEEHCDLIALPYNDRTGQKIFDLVRPTLDKLLALAPPAPPAVELRVSLTPDEIVALQEAHEHVRVHMAHDHSWEVRDAAVEAIGKVIAAARQASP